MTRIITSYFVLFVCCLLVVFSFLKGIKGGGAEVKIGYGKLERKEGGETVARTHCMGAEYIFNFLEKINIFQKEKCWLIANVFSYI